jgi:hypothetical protein
MHWSQCEFSRIRAFQRTFCKSICRLTELNQDVRGIYKVIDTTRSDVGPRWIYCARSRFSPNPLGSIVGFGCLYVWNFPTRFLLIPLFPPWMTLVTFVVYRSSKVWHLLIDSSIRQLILWLLLTNTLTYNIIGLATCIGPPPHHHQTPEHCTIGRRWCSQPNIGACMSRTMCSAQAL